VISTTTSDNEAYVWIWLPGTVEPIVAGRISTNADQYLFNYGKSYLSRDDAIPLHAWELPLQPGFISPLSELTLAGCLRDSSPDEWGRRVVLNLASPDAEHAGDLGNINELFFFLNSGSNRVGSLDFQHSGKEYRPRVNASTTLEELIGSVNRVENGIPLNPELDKALFYGASIGGSRPKACITDSDKQYIAKFSSQSDTDPVVKREYLAMRLAAEVGLHVATVHLLKVANEDILLVERFDRVHSSRGWYRETVLSALTLFELDEKMHRYASYTELAEIIRSDFSYPIDTQKELFKRLVFNILVGNTDDHARNHAALWDGEQLHLTPAYDICPQKRPTNEASQAMQIEEDRHLSRLDICLNAAEKFSLKTDTAMQIIEHQIRVIKAKWELVCDEAQLLHAERQALWGRQIFNPFSIEGYERLVQL